MYRIYECRISKLLSLRLLCGGGDTCDVAGDHPKHVQGTEMNLGGDETPPSPKVVAPLHTDITIKADLAGFLDSSMLDEVLEEGVFVHGVGNNF